MKWTEEKTLKFVGLYRDSESLWNIASPTYKNKNMRQRAIENLVKDMEKEGFGIQEAKQKIKNIRAMRHEYFFPGSTLSPRHVFPISFLVQHFVHFLYQQIKHSFHAFPNNYATFTGHYQYKLYKDTSKVRVFSNRVWHSYSKTGRVELGRVLGRANSTFYSPANSTNVNQA